MKRGMLMGCLCISIALFFLSVPTYADVITFSSRAAFNAAAPGLPVETFESGLVAPGALLTVCAGPQSFESSSCFPTGSLLPGVVYSASPLGSMVVLGAGVAGNTSKVLGPNFFADTLNLTFTQTTAVGLDVFPGLSAGNVMISVFNPSNIQLGSFITPAAISGTFFGVLSTTDLIGRINVNSQASGAGELIDNVAFQAVPEPSSLMLVGGGLAVLIGFYSRRRKREREAA